MLDSVDSKPPRPNKKVQTNVGRDYAAGQDSHEKNMKKQSEKVQRDFRASGSRSQI